VGGPRVEGVVPKMTRKRTARPMLLTLLAAAWVLGVAGSALAEGTAVVNLADGFDFPVGKPDAAGYYKARGLRLRSPQHFGEDWNGRAGGNSDRGDPIYSMGDGIVTFAYNVKAGWGNVVIIRHAYRDSASGQVQYCDSLYGHLLAMMATVGQKVRRGEQIGTLGDNGGMYPAHLHFEVRSNLHIGMQRNSVPADATNWLDPTQFITKYRRLNREWRAVPMPIGTYQEYNGFKGL
jgi:murein DD-endopeptidase MepM/ murein hydrolase activator NlpD